MDLGEMERGDRDKAFRGRERFAGGPLIIIS